MGSGQRSTTKKGTRGKARRALRVIRENVAGIDWGSRQHGVCCPGQAEQELEVKTFGTTTLPLQKLADWLEAEGIESVAMEATSVYWIPLYELWEARGIEVVLVHARQLSHVPGRKTDLLDCQWLQLLHSCGLLRAQMAEHWTGNWRADHLFNLKMAFRLYQQVQDILAAYEQQILCVLQQRPVPERARLEPPPHPHPAQEKALQRRGEQPLRTALGRFAGVDLVRIDGLSGGAAPVVRSEVGLDLEAFPTEQHFVSWLRLSPQTAFSAGKPLPKKNTGTGATRVAGVLRMAALSLSKSWSALGAYFRAIARRKGGATAVLATARKLAIYVYRMLRFGQDYVDDGAPAYEQRFHHKRLISIRSIAKQMGYQLVPAKATAEVSG